MSLLIRKPPMSKADEMAWLDRAIAELGPDTYLGACFIDQRHGIADDLRSDIPPLQFAHLRAVHAESLEQLKVTYREITKAQERLAAANLSLEAARREEAAALRRRDVTVRETAQAARGALQSLRSLAHLI